MASLQSAFGNLLGQLGEAFQNSTMRDVDGDYSFNASQFRSDAPRSATSAQHSRTQGQPAQFHAEMGGLLFRGLQEAMVNSAQASSDAGTRSSQNGSTSEPAGNLGSLLGRMATDFGQAMQNVVSSTEFHEVMQNMTDTFGEVFGEEQSRPATSLSTMESLPTVTVTEYDLKDNQSSSCVVCLEDHVIGGKAIRLPCGHLFHKDCIKQWLQKDHTCPVCRFELPTDNEAYERARREGRQARKPRFRVADLSRKNARELRFLAQHLSVDCTGCIEKSDLVDRIVASGAVDIVSDEEHHDSASSCGCAAGTAAAPSMSTSEPSLSQLKSMSVRELKEQLVQHHIDHSGCLEKGDLIQQLVDAGLVSSHEHEQNATTSA